MKNERKSFHLQIAFVPPPLKKKEGFSGKGRGSMKIFKECFDLKGAEQKIFIPAIPL